MTTENIPETMDSEPPGRVPCRFLFKSGDVLDVELTDLDMEHARRAWRSEVDLTVHDDEGDEIFVRTSEVSSMAFFFSQREKPVTTDEQGILPFPNRES